jgi:transketolase C-terminal domain/subunit
MGTAETAFAMLVGVLAGVAVVGALVFAITWEIAAIRRVLERNRKPSPEETFWSDRRAVRIPERRADA